MTNRRHFLKTGIAGTAALMAGCVPVESSPDQDKLE
ncbi:MAG: twin-arginine translocation signal domain-containing protein, partial [Flavobacteriales bacterium]|nr:twin-arginine translocation signal domain-containing protein [Flavobacteriales bacterium]